MVIDPPTPTRQRPPLPQPVRIRLSALGAVRCPSLAGREGIIIGAGRYRSAVRVLFDDLKSPMSLHSTYIEPVVEEGGSKAIDAPPVASSKVKGPAVRLSARERNACLNES